MNLALLLLTWLVESHQVDLLDGPASREHFLVGPGGCECQVAGPASRMRWSLNSI